MSIHRGFLRKSHSNLKKGVFGMPGCLFKCLARNFGLAEGAWGAAKHPGQFICSTRCPVHPTNPGEKNVRKGEQVSENPGNTILQWFVATNRSRTEKSEYLQRVTKPRRELQRWGKETPWTTSYLWARLLELGSKFFPFLSGIMMCGVTKEQGF